MRSTPTVDGKPGVVVALTCGPDRDWLKNLKAAGFRAAAVGASVLFTRTA
jgi:hypothetical protein